MCVTRWIGAADRNGAVSVFKNDSQQVLLLFSELRSIEDEGAVATDQNPSGSGNAAAGDDRQALPGWQWRTPQTRPELARVCQQLTKGLLLLRRGRSAVDPETKTLPVIRIPEVGI